MLFNLALSRAWLLSKGAQRVYFICAIGSGVFLVQCFAVPAVDAVFRNASVDLFAVITAVPFLVAAALLWVGMAYFWLTVDIHQRGAGPLWAVAFLLGWLGAVFYYAARYRRLARTLGSEGPSLLTFSHGGGV